jgi:hypothetical protein
MDADKTGDRMRYVIAAAVLAACARGAAALPSAPPAIPPVLTDDIIKKAVRETIAEYPQPIVAYRNAGAFSAGTSQDRMSAAFEQAKVPDCLHGDALKHQPARLGPVNVVGPYSLPWVVAAALRGKCN